MERVIGLDEVGRFESRADGCRFIGGFVGNYSENMEMELEELLKKICSDFNEKTEGRRKKNYKVFYPNSLHGSGTVFFSAGAMPGQIGQPLGEKEKKDQDKELKKEFQKALQEQVVQYLCEKGYELYMFLDPYIGNGFEEFPQSSGNLVDSKQGANLYERMAVLSMYNQIFYTLRDTAEHYHLHFATRTLNNDNDALANLYEEWERQSKKQLEKFRKITTVSTYKTALSVMLYDKKNLQEYQNVGYSFYVKPINYQDNKDEKSNKGDTTPFLYVADIVCSYIKTIWKEQCGKLLLKMKKNEITSEHLLTIAEKYPIEIRIYDRSEVYLRSMLEAVKDGNLMKYYEELYELQESKELYKEFYLQHWIPRINTYIEKCMRENPDYRDTVIRLAPEFCVTVDGYMGAGERNPEKGLFIADRLIHTLDTITDSRSRAKLMKSFFLLHDICLRGYNHRGSLEDAKRMIEKGEVYKRYVDTDTYLAHTIRTIQYYFDSFQFQRALEIGESLAEPVEELEKAYKVIHQVSSRIADDITKESTETPESHYLLAGKIYSSIGQAAAFARKYSSANRYFTKALNVFEVGSADYEITFSYYLHYYIAKKDKKKYQENAQAYFGTSDLTDQFENAKKAQDGGFKLLVFIKAFRVFFAKDSSMDCYLREMLEWVREHLEEHTHPWELIYKNLYESILLQRNQFPLKEYEWLKNAALHCITHPDCTIQMIQIGFKAGSYFATEEDAENTFAQDCLTKEELQLCQRFIEGADELILEELVEKLDKLLVYTYC